MSGICFAPISISSCFVLIRVDATIELFEFEVLTDDDSAFGNGTLPQYYQVLCTVKGSKDTKVQLYLLNGEDRYPVDVICEDFLSADCMVNSSVSAESADSSVVYNVSVFVEWNAEAIGSGPFTQTKNGGDHVYVCEADDKVKTTSVKGNHAR